LVLLVVSALAATLSEPREDAPVRESLPLILVALFLITMGLPILLSEDMGRSLRLSASLLPALLLFFLITEHFTGVTEIRRLYLSCLIAGLGISIVSLWIACLLKEGTQVIVHTFLLMISLCVGVPSGYEH
jgi:cyanate permease